VSQRRSVTSGKGGRPRLWTELVLVAVGYWLYSLIRNAASGHEIAALRRAERILDVERALHLDVELAINRAADRVDWLIVGMNYYYATLHIVVTIGVLVWLYRFHPRCYRPARTALFATSGLALVGFYAFALAPPRFLARYGFIDTVAVHNTWGSMASGDVGALSNQYAAMPSLHIGWSVWCAIAIIMLARRRWVRVLGGLYPAATLVVILATANHFLIDAVGGLLTLAAGFAVQRLITQGPAYGPGPAGETVPAFAEIETDLRRGGRDAGSTAAATLNGRRAARSSARGLGSRTRPRPAPRTRPTREPAGRGPARPAG
jgi:hypothetical protein